jgi:hypothetical protein
VGSAAPSLATRNFSVVISVATSCVLSLLQLECSIPKTPTDAIPMAPIGPDALEMSQGPGVRVLQPGAAPALAL